MRFCLDVRLQYPADEQLGELPAVQALEHLPDRLGQAGTEQARRADAIEDERAAFGDVEGLCEQFGEVVHAYALVAEDFRERVVFFLRAFCPQDVVEQQLGGVAGGEAGQFEARAVHDDLAEPADLRLNTERHTCEHYASVAGCRPTAALNSVTGRQR